MIKDRTEGKLLEAILHGKKTNDNSLLEILQRYSERENGEMVIYTDFAPLSFAFVFNNNEGCMMYNGGIIYHGKHDNFGNGGSPTFSVCIDPEPNSCWRVHT